MYVKKRLMKCTILTLPIIFTFYIFGGFLHFLEEDFHTNFHYPDDVNVSLIVDEIISGKFHKPHHLYNFEYKEKHHELCRVPVKLMFLVKSSPENYARRNAIRTSWGSINDIDEIETIFLIGNGKSYDERRLDEESEIMQDLVRGNFSDSYFNLTLKTLMGLKFAYDFCLNTSEFFMFVDDDYYVSTSNILEFLKNPYQYPGTFKNENYTNFHPDNFSLYAGYIHENANPIRKFFSKWFISLNEYPYDKYPPYSAGGAYILSRKALKRIYLASLFTKIIRFEDIFIGLLAYRVGIKAISNKEYFNIEKKYTYEKFKKILASHGYEDPRELWEVWNEQTVGKKHY